MIPPPSPPLLRSPPFPWVPSAVAAISVPGRTAVDDPENVLESMREGRVGGTFWSTGDDPWSREPGSVAVMKGGLDEGAMMAWLAGRLVHDGYGATVAASTLRSAILDRIASAAYRDPFTGRSIDVLDAIAILADWRRGIEVNRPIGAVAGIARWKREAIDQFLWDGDGYAPFSAPDEALEQAEAVAYWPSRCPVGLPEEAARRGIETWPIEDGFLRSNGLGVECHPPMSILVDRTGGLHFAPGRASELETILENHRFSQDQLRRARSLRQRIVAARLGKYGVDRGQPSVLERQPGRETVLAIGQVDDDLSVIRGGSGLSGNCAFLRRVRAEEPRAYVVYRPHPDVALGLRQGQVVDPVAAGLVDRVVLGGSLLSLLDQVDRVHVLSSLSGFEALLRGRAVSVHGAPFYAGWGLTRDLGPTIERRTRRLSLDELVAGALIMAPRYRDPLTLLPCPPEILVERLAASDRPALTAVTGFRRALGGTRRLLRAGRGLS